MQTIEDWLAQLGLGKYAAAFVENDVDLRALPHIAESDLREIGVSLGHRKIILAAISELAQQRSNQQPPSAEASEAAADRRLLSVFFCDLVGSTPLSAQLDPEDMHELIRRYQDSVAGAVTRFGGHVAKYLGDGVLAYFGWPMAYEDHAERSIRAALEAMAAVDVLQSPNAQALKARIGIASGHVVVGNTVGNVNERGSIAGDTPNLAARLQGAAAPGQILVADSTRRLAGQSFEFMNLGERELKGFSSPVAIFEVRGEREVESRFEAAHASGLSKFVGRASEIGLLLERWELAKSGQGQMIFLSGEAGIGKSRLVEALEERLRESQHELIRLQCSPYHATSAFYPIVERLSRVAQFAPTDDQNTRVEKFRKLVSRYGENPSEVGAIYAELLSLDLGDEFRPPALSAHQRKEILVRTIANRLLLATRIAPVLMVVEDAHWMDPSTSEVLQELVSRLHGTSALIVVTHRTEWSADWTSGLAHATTLSIGRLTREQMRELIESMDRNIPEELVEMISERTDGIPLFIEELTRSITESGKLTSLNLEIPDSLQGSLMTRLDRLPTTAKEVAQIASVIGREFDRDLLSKIAGLDERTLEGALAHLETSQIVVAGGALRNDALVFRHALIQDAAYQSLLNRRRRHFHENIAKVLVDQYPDVTVTQPELIAQHYENAQRIELALPYWMKAGERALARSANYEAVDHFQNALTIVEQAPEAPNRQKDLLAAVLKLGDALYAAGRMTDSVVKYRLAAPLARKAADTLGFVRAVVGLDGSQFLSSNSLSETLPLLEEAMAMVQPEDKRSRCQLLSHLARAYAYLSDSEKAAQCRKVGIELARDVGDKTSLVELSVLPFLTASPVKSIVERNDRIARVDEIRRLAGEIDDDDVLTRVLSIDTYVSTELGDRARADRAVDALENLGTKRQHLNVQFYARIARAMMAILDGRFTAAEEIAEDALKLGKHTLGVAPEGVYGMQMFAIRREQSRLSEVAPVMKLLIEENPDEVTWLPGFALVAFDLGYREAAQRRLEDLSSTRFVLPLDGKRSASLSFLAEVAAGLGDVEASRALYNLMLDYKEMTVTIGMATVCFGAASRYLGMLSVALGEFDRASKHYEHALEMNSAIRSRPWLAHAEAEYSDLLMKIGSRAAIKRAMSLSEHARSTAAELGMVRLQQRLKSTIH